MSENANIIINLIGFVLAFAVLYAAWPRVVVDSIRQRIFEIRDELFDMAANGKIGFDDPVYIHFRDTANALIRYCHAISWPRIVFLALPVKASGLERQYEPIHESIRDNQPLRDKVKRLEVEMLVLVLGVMYLRSPLLLLLTPLAVILISIPALNPVQRRRLKRSAARLSGEIVADAAMVA